MFTDCVNSRKMRVPLSPWCIFIDSANDKGSVGRMLVSHSPFGSTQSSLTVLPTHWDRLWQDFT